MSLIEKLMEQLNCDRAAAEFLLEASNNDYEVAINLHLDSAGSTSQAQGAGMDPLPMEEEVRAPIPPKFEVLCPDPIPGARFLQRARARGGATSSSFLSSSSAFRDFEQETRAQEALMGLGTSGMFGANRRSHRSPLTSQTEENNAATERLTAVSAHRRKLEELFKPPIDLIFKGSFFMAREHGWELGQWLLVNIQDDHDFACHTINRDVWANSNVRKLLENTFVLWQASNVSEHGRKFMQFYPNVTMPYIAIIDSSTGELMDTFRKSDPRAFCLFLKEFIKRRGRLPRRNATQAASNGRSSPASMGDAAAAAVDDINEVGCGDGGAKRKGKESLINGSSNTKRKSRSPSPTSSSSTCKRARVEGGGGGEVSTPLRTSPVNTYTQSRLLDITEEDQLKLAIAESLKLSQSSSKQDDDTESDASLDTFPQDDSDDGEVNYSFEEAGGASPSKAASAGKEEGGASSSSSSNRAGNKKGPQSEWKTAKGCLSNGAALGGPFDRLLCAPTVAGSSSSSVPHSKPSVKKEDNSKVTDRGSTASDETTKDSWKVLASEYSGASITLRVLFPDGERETLQLPSEAPLKVVQVFLGPRGYSSPGHRALSGYPRRDLFSLPPSTSLKDAGVAARDTILIERD